MDAEDAMKTPKPSDNSKTSSKPVKHWLADFKLTPEEWAQVRKERQEELANNRPDWVKGNPLVVWPADD
jgi:hypothetical protein